MTTTCGHDNYIPAYDAHNKERERYANIFARLPSFTHGRISVMSIQHVTFQFASRSDAPTIASLSRDLIEEGLGWQYRTERIRELIGDAETVTLVARGAELAIGFSIMTFGDERAHLVLLAVRPAYQRRGIARRMTQWLIESAATAGVASIHVELRVRNKAAYEFYRSIGFAETLRLAGYYRGRETAIRMMRMLRKPGITVEPWRPPART
jgi:GNAT superfamily N-acetyltransferase